MRGRTDNFDLGELLLIPVNLGEAFVTLKFPLLAFFRAEFCFYGVYFCADYFCSEFFCAEFFFVPSFSLCRVFVCAQFFCAECFVPATSASVAATAAADPSLEAVAPSML